MAERIIATCEDRRLPKKVEALASGVHVSNAGCNIASMRDTLVEIARGDKEVREIVAYVHTDCGAMGAVDDAKKGNLAKYGERVKRSLLNIFMPKAWKDRNELERKVNVDEQRKALEEIPKLVGRDLSVRVEAIETSTISVPEIDHDQFALLILKPSEASVPEAISRAGLKQFATYVVQLLNFNEALGDVELTVNNLHVRRIVFGFSSEDERERVKADMELFEKYFPGVKAETADISD